MSSSRELFDLLSACVARGEPCVLATVVAVEGSAPRHEGAMMVWRRDGPPAGTVGGGALEAAVLEASGALAAAGSGTRMLRLNLGRDLGMKCGGHTHVFLQAFSAPRLLLFGAGHVGQALFPLARDLGFRVTVVDARADLLTADRFPGAAALCTGYDPSAWADPPPDADTYCVVATTDHATDARLCVELSRHAPRYLGMIGSSRKRRATEKAMAEAGLPAEAAARLRTPMGLPIGAETPPEIAVSIAAELVATRRTGQDSTKINNKINNNNTSDPGEPSTGPDRPKRGE